LIVNKIDNTILFYHPETGKYSIKTFIHHKELLADAVLEKDDFYLSKWYLRNDGVMQSAVGEVIT
jgi:hypothetical protein